MERVLRPETGAEIARFFQRVFAALIDGFILALVFFFAVIPYLGWFAPESLLLQAAISFVYFSLLNSSLGGGATLGKRAMGVRVVGRKGDYISLPRALVRSAVDTLPNTLGIYIPMVMPTMPWPAAEIGAAIGSSFALANIYLYIFNWQTRQVLHDLVVGSFVVKAESSEQPFQGRTPFGHVAFAVVLVAALGFVFTRVALFQEAVNGPALCDAPISSAVRTLPFVERAFVNRAPLTLTKKSDPDHTTVLAYVTDGATPEQGNAVAKKSIAACPALRDERLLKIILVPHHKGYSLIPRLSIQQLTVGEWHSGLTAPTHTATRAAPKEWPCSKPITQAVERLPFARTVEFSEGELVMPQGHFKQITVGASIDDRTPSEMAQDVARRTLKACPAIADDEMLQVVITPLPHPTPTRFARSFDAPAKEWRSRIAKEDGESEAADN